MKYTCYLAYSKLSITIIIRREMFLIFSFILRNLSVTADFFHTTLSYPGSEMTYLFSRFGKNKLECCQLISFLFLPGYLLPVAFHWKHTIHYSSRDRVCLYGKVHSGPALSILGNSIHPGLSKQAHLAFTSSNLPSLSNKILFCQRTYKHI